METPTRFDLNTAIQGWRQELAAQPSLAPDARRELETHLCDSIAELRQRGLNDEESFWLARRRAGQPQQIAEEFAKADPAKAWRERVFWVAIGLFAMYLWSGVPLYLMDSIHSRIIYLVAHNFFLPEWVLFYLPFRPQSAVEQLLRNPIFDILFRFLPLICLVALLARGRLGRAVSASQFLFQSRRRLLFTGAASIGLYYTWALFEAWRHLGRVIAGPEIPTVAVLIHHAFANAIMSALLLGLIA